MAGVNARLVDVDTGKYLWANRYERIAANADLVQDDMAKSLAAALDVAVVSADQQRVLRGSSASLRAWEVYERGLWHFARMRIEENEKARSYLRQALNREPGLSKAYQWLVYVYIQDGIQYRTIPLAEARGVAETLAMKAIASDPNDAGAHAALGFVAQLGNDLPAALAKAEEALSLNPNDGDALRLKGACQLGQGFGEDGAKTCDHRLVSGQTTR